MPTRSPTERRIGPAAWVTQVWAARGVAGAALSVLLLPAEGVYRLVIGARNRAWDRGWSRTQAGVLPVVSIGNLAVGGTGKTPFAAWVAARLAGSGERPAILHGGYADDEPALHRRWNPSVPVIVGRDRVAAVERAAGQGATVAILDDGFQHRRLERDLDIVLVAAETWHGRRSLLPRGPWREPAAALRRADVVVVTRKSADAETSEAVLAEIRHVAPGVHGCVAAIEATAWQTPDGAQEKPTGPCLAVAGIAAPEIFLANARAAGADVEEALFFGDHHTYTGADARRILRQAGGRGIVTTEKDAFKLERLLPGSPIRVLRQFVRIEMGETELNRMLDGIRR